MRRIKEIKTVNINGALRSFSMDHNIDEYAVALGIEAYINECQDSEKIQVLKQVLDNWGFEYSGKPISYSELDGSAQMVYEYIQSIIGGNMREAESRVKRLRGVVLDVDADVGAGDTTIYLSLVKSDRHMSSDVVIRMQEVNEDIRRYGVYEFYNLILIGNSRETTYSVNAGDYKYLGQAEETMNGLDVSKYKEDFSKGEKIIMRKAEKKEEKQEGTVVTVDKDVAINDEFILEAGDKVRVHTVKTEEKKEDKKDAKKDDDDDDDEEDKKDDKKDDDEDDKKDKED